MAVRDKSVQIIISAEVASALRAFDSAGKAIHRFSVETEKIGRAIDGVFSPLMRGLTTAVTAIGTGMGMLAKSALTVGGNFELTMTRLAGVVNEGKESFDALTKKAKEMGETLPITATEAAEGMLLLAQAGKKTNEILAITPHTTALAISQNYGFAESTRLVVSTMSMFGLEAKDAERIVDTFTNACNNSAMTLEKFSNGMDYIGDLASSFGLSFEETAGMLSLLSRSGLEGEKMATSLRAILINLRDPTAQASAAFKELGISLTDASGQMKPPVQLLRELAEAGMSVDQAIQIFDRRAIGAGLNLSKFVNELDGMVKKMWETGTTAARLKELLGTFKNIAKEVASAWEATLIVVFDQIMVKSKALTQEITALMRAFNEWAREQKVFEKIFSALLKGFGIAVGNVNRFKESLKAIDVDALAEKFKGFAEGVKTAYNAFMNFAEKIPWGFLAEHLDKIAYTITFGWAAGKFLLISAALAKFGAVLLDVAKALGAFALGQSAAEGGFLFSAATGTSLAAFGAGLAGAMAWILALPEALADNADNAKLWQEAIDGNAEALAKLSKEEQAFIQQNYLIKKAVAETAESFDETGKKVGESMTDMVKRVVDTYSDETVRVNQLVALFSTQITDAMKVSGGVEAFIGQFAKMEPELQNLMSKVVFTVQEGAEEIGKAGEVTKSFSDSVSEGIQKALDEYQKYAVEMTAKTKELIAATGINANEAWAVMETDLKAKAQATSKGLVNEFKNPAVAAAFAQAFGGMAKAAGDEMTLRISDALNDVKSAISAISAESRKAIDEFLQGMEDLAPAFQNLQLQQVRETTDSITFMADNGMSKIIRVYDKATGEIKDVSQTIADSGRDSSKAFEIAARDIEAAGRRTGTAWTTGAIEPLQRTGETAKTTSTAIGALSTEAVKVADGFKAAISGIDAAISTMGERMVSALSVAVEGLKTVFEQIGIDSGNSMMTALNRQVEAAIPSLSTTAENAGMSMGQSMGRSLESAMQTSLQNIARAVDAMARRAAAAVPAAAGSGGNVDAAALAAAYAREG